MVGDNNKNASPKNVKLVVPKTAAKNTASPRMKNLRTADTGVSSVIWIDEGATYKRGGHGKRVKFVPGKGIEGYVKIDGSIDEDDCKKVWEKYRKECKEVQQYVLNNKYALEKIMDKKVIVKEVLSFMIKGSKVVSQSKIEELRKNVDDIIMKKTRK